MQQCVPPIISIFLFDKETLFLTSTVYQELFVHACGISLHNQPAKQPSHGHERERVKGRVRERNRRFWTPIGIQSQRGQSWNFCHGKRRFLWLLKETNIRPTKQQTRVTTCVASILNEQRILVPV
jgi:hypothetical protein